MLLLAIRNPIPPKISIFLNYNFCWPYIFHFPHYISYLPFFTGSILYISQLFTVYFPNPNFQISPQTSSTTGKIKTNTGNGCRNSFLSNKMSSFQLFIYFPIFLLDKEINTLAIHNFITNCLYETPRKATILIPACP